MSSLRTPALPEIQKLKPIEEKCNNISLIPNPNNKEKQNKYKKFMFDDILPIGFKDDK